MNTKKERLYYYTCSIEGLDKLFHDSIGEKIVPIDVLRAMSAICRKPEQYQTSHELALVMALNKMAEWYAERDAEGAESETRSWRSDCALLDRQA